MDALDDICPLCGRPIEEGENWVLHERQLAHEHCVLQHENGEEGE